MFPLPKPCLRRSAWPSRWDPTLRCLLPIPSAPRPRSKRFERFEDSAAAAGGGASAAGLPPQLSIQLSNGKSMSLGSSPGALPNYHSALSDVSTQAASSTASGVPRLPTANSGMPLLPASGSGVCPPPPAVRRTASTTTRPSIAIPSAGSPFASAAALDVSGEGGSDATASMHTAGSTPASTGSGVTVEPGKHLLVPAELVRCY